MSQTVPATCVLGPGKTGLTIGYRVLNLDGTEYSAFTTTGVAETSTAGTYRVAGGVVVPLAGGYIVFGTASVDYAEATVDSASAVDPQTIADAMAVATSETPQAGSVLAELAGVRSDVLDGLDELEGAIGGQVVEGTYTRDELLRIMAAALAGVTDGSGTSEVTFRGVDGATVRITAKLADEGNRTAVVLDGGTA